MEKQPPLSLSDPKSLEPLIEELVPIRDDVVATEKRMRGRIEEVHSNHRDSARNLIHYLALRRQELPTIQEKLASLGLSSLGRCEAHVLASLDAVVRILCRLAGKKEPVNGAKPVGFYQGDSLLDAHTAALLGPRPQNRAVRIMVTMSHEGADDYSLMRDLLATGMDCMRINLARDDPKAWARMVSQLRRAEKDQRKSCKILMDLSGPKLRTGPLGAGPQVIRWKTKRDAFGHVTEPSRIWLCAEEKPTTPPVPAEGILPVQKGWLEKLKKGDRIEFTDARGARRSLKVAGSAGNGVWAECNRRAYVKPGTVLNLTRRQKGSRAHKRLRHAKVGGFPAAPCCITLKRGDVLVLTRDLAPGNCAELDERGRVVRPATIGCTLPEVFTQVRPGERVWFDDGKIGGIVQSVHDDQIYVQILHAKAEGENLGADKGINLPDSDLRLPALTPKDVEDLKYVVANADMVGLSFVHSPEDVTDLRAHLKKLGGEKLGIVLKIETRRAFEQLPDLLVTAMRHPVAGVMIARGDLAVECGYQRLAELQEEILWACEAAHLPVIWATQVLESLAKKGVPSRAEITDAAMGERAECVMLNKGPHVTEATRTLDDILRRMQRHQTKKSSLLRKLASWALPAEGGAAVPAAQPPLVADLKPPADERLAPVPQDRKAVLVVRAGGKGTVSEDEAQRAGTQSRRGTKPEEGKEAGA